MDHFVFFDNFSPAELSALRLEGEISQREEMWDEVHDWKTRSSRILCRERHPLVLTGSSAVWAMGLAQEPERHIASTVTKDRIRDAIRPALVIEERTLSPHETWLHGIHGITSPLRTITDILRSTDVETLKAKHLCTAVMSAYAVSQEDVYRKLTEMISVPNKRMALSRAEKLTI